MQLAKTLADQRGKQYGFGVDNDELEYNVFDQCRNVDQTPTNNMRMENKFGMADNRMRIKPYVQTVSRDILLHETRDLREEDDNPAFYTKMRTALAELKQIQTEYAIEQEKLKKEGLNKKELECLRRDGRKLQVLKSLKEGGGPFTCPEEIDAYMSNVSVENTLAQNRMKNEVTYARDSSKSLPKSHDYFKIMTTGSNGKRRNKTAAEYAESLKLYFSKTEHQQTASMADFRAALEN